MITPIEIFGYISMIVVLISMTMDNIKNLRILNSIACVMFIVYGSFIGATPIMIMNTLVIIINIYGLIKGK